MSHTARTIGQAANTLTKPKSVFDVFNQHSRETGGDWKNRMNTPTNFATDGGLTISKRRDGGTTQHWAWYDTERPQTRPDGGALDTSVTTVDTVNANLPSWDDNGNTTVANDGTLTSGRTMNWMFKKEPNFFDIVTYTGTGAVQEIAHNLGTEPGFIITKSYTSSNNWHCYHRMANGGGAPGNYYIDLNSSGSVNAGSALWNNTKPTSTHFTVGSGTTNTSGQTYVAYLFAHHDGTGTFGPSGRDDIIKCGRYTGNGSNNGTLIELGFEPQFVIIKDSVNQNWQLFDNHRGIGDDDTTDWSLHFNINNGDTQSGSVLDLRSNGFFLPSGTTSVNASSREYLYIAIRRDNDHLEPTSATEVFDLVEGGAAAASVAGKFISETVEEIDFAFERRYNATESWNTFTRHTNNYYLRLNTVSAKSVDATQIADYPYGYNSNTTNDTEDMAWLWRNCKGFFDVTAYKGTGSALTVQHGLGTEPEMMWIKKHDGTGDWVVQGSVITPSFDKFVEMNNTVATASTTAVTGVTSTTFDLGTYGDVNTSGSAYVAMLFASMPGISKVGTFTGNGTSITIDCGFTSGPRCVMVKRLGATNSGHWLLYDTNRGIIEGNDHTLTMSQATTPVTNADVIDSTTTGFTLHYAYSETDTYNPNATGEEYLYYAVA